MLIRDFVPADYDDLKEVWLLDDLGNPQRGDNLDIIMQSIAMGGRLIVAQTDEGRVVGTCWLTFDGRRLHMHHFGVHPQYQHHGVGHKIMREALHFVKQKGYQVKIEVHRNNAIAIDFYTKYGFIDLGDYNVYIIRDIAAIPY